MPNTANDILTLHRIAHFIYQYELEDGVKDAFEGKVEYDMYNFLINRAITLKKKEYNPAAWIKFILHLDKKNSRILMDHIHENQSYFDDDSFAF